APLWRRRACVDKSRDGLEPSVVRELHEVGARQVQGSLIRTTCGPAEAQTPVVGFDLADKTDPIARELLLRLREHAVDGVVSLAVAMRIDVAAAIRPCPGDELTATFRVCFVPGS